MIIKPIPTVFPKLRFVVFIIFIVEETRQTFLGTNDEEKHLQ